MVHVWYHSFNCAFVQKQKCILDSKKAKRFHQTTKKKLMLENGRILLPGSRTWRITSYGNSTLKILHSQVAKEYMQLISWAPQPPLGNTIVHAQQGGKPYIKLKVRDFQMKYWLRMEEDGGGWWLAGGVAGLLSDFAWLWSARFSSTLLHCHTSLQHTAIIHCTAFCGLHCSAHGL